MSGDPGDVSGGDFGGGDDDRVPIPEPPPPPPPPNTSCYFTSATPEALTVNTYDSLIEQTYNFTADRGPTNSTISWSISPTTYGSTFTGSDTNKSITLSFPNKSTGQGVFTVIISNQGGSASQQWTYQILSSSGGGVSYWRLQSNQSIINTNNNGVLVNGMLTANRVLGVQYADITNAPTSVWTLESKNNIINTNVNGVRMNGIIIGDKKLIIHDNKLGWIFEYSTQPVIMTTIRPGGFYTDGSLYIYYNEICDSNGLISWKNLKDVPALPTVEDSKAGIALGAIGSVLGAFIVGGLFASVLSTKAGNFFRDLFNFDGGGDPDVKRRDSANGDQTYNLRWIQINENPIARSTLIGGYGGVILNNTTRRYDIGMNGIQYVSSDTGMGLYTVGKNYFQIDAENCVAFNGNYAGNAVKLIGYDTRRFYGDVETGLWKFTNNGVYYNGQLIMYHQSGTMYFNGVATGNAVGEPEITPDVPITDPNAGGANTRPDRNRRLLDFSQNQTTNSQQPLAERSTRPTGTTISQPNGSSIGDRAKVAVDKFEEGVRTTGTKLIAKGAKAGRSVGQTLEKLGDNMTKLKTWKGIGRTVMNNIERGALRGKQTFNSIMPG